MNKMAKRALELSVTLAGILSFTSLTWAQSSPESTPAANAVTEEGKADSTNTTSVAPVEAAATPAKKLGLGLILGYNSSLHTDGDYEKKESSDLTISPTYKLSDNFTASALAIVTKELRGAEDTTISDVQLGLIRAPIELTSSLKVSPRLVVNLPTNEENREMKTFRGGAGLVGRVLYDIQPLGVKTTGFYQLSYVRNVHDFERAGDRTANRQQSITNRLSIDFPITKKIAINLDNRFTTGWNYQGAISESFVLGQSISYTISEALELGLAHGTEGPAFKNDGTTSNVKLIDEQGSTITTSLSYTY